MMVSKSACLLFLVTCMISSGGGSSSSSSCCCCDSSETYTVLLQQVGPRKVGGRTEVGDVETNREVQELGHFAVDEFNRRAGLLHDHHLLFFSRVLQAQRQVVSGIKYYLLVLAKQQQSPAAAQPQENIINNVERVFQAVVVLKPWLHDSKQLISFKPSKDK